MKLGIIGAMQIEVDALKENMKHKTVTCQTGMEFCEGILEGLPTVVVQCGVGKVNAALCVQILCDRFGVTHLVNTGIAGSLCADLDIGDLVVSQDAMYHDFTIQDIHPDWPVGRLPMPEGAITHFPGDEVLIRLALAAGEENDPGHVRLGRVATGDQFIGSAERKNKIIADTGAICAEMEGAAIAHAAYRNGVPFVILRAISDKADDSAEMDYPTFEAIAARRCAAVTQTMAKKLRDM